MPSKPTDKPSVALPPYDHQAVEAKWQKKWEQHKVFTPDLASSPRPFYNLMMFPYPSAEGLHVGNMYAFTGADIYGRYMRMRGHDVFEPIGLDGFGIHSENYALRVGQHPQRVARKTEKNFYRQLRATGNAYDWTRTLETYHPSYYRWTQWLFVQMFKNGLAYRAKSPVNWCPSCKTVLADEQVEGGICERCQTPAETKKLEQWFFRITRYADQLLDNLAKIDWSSKVKQMQRNWIGRQRGAEIEFALHYSRLVSQPQPAPLNSGKSPSKSPTTSETIKVFTTRPDTLFGVTFMAIAPEHPLVASLLSPQSPILNSGQVKEYVKKARQKTELERISKERNKTGIQLKGITAVHPVTAEKLPIFVADYVLTGYGTGAIMGVPAHDQRDFEFAQKYELPVKRVIAASDGDTSEITCTEQVQEEGGILINSSPWNGWRYPQDLEKILSWLEKKGIGKHRTTYHLRDWLISRQRYWGPPIPMIYCPKCAAKGESYFTQHQHPQLDWHHAGWYPVSQDQLPVKLPHLKDYQPQGTGRGPLADHPEFYQTACPSCGSPAKRETDVSDTFLDSSWYFLRYPSIDAKTSTKFPFDPQLTKKWLPVDMYIGGAEHSVLHLLYARFVTMALHDWGFLDFEEPFSRFFAHGLIIKDGAKMSKSRGNVVVPDEYIKKYGVDTLRMYLMFLGPFDQGGDFQDQGVKGVVRFLEKVWRLFLNPRKLTNDSSPQLLSRLHRLIQKVDHDIPDFKFNTAIAAMMEFVNFWRQEREYLSRKDAEKFLLILAPFAPFITEELYQQIKIDNQSIHQHSWPEFARELVAKEETEIPVQINGKFRTTLKVKSQKSKVKSQIEKMALANEKVQKWLKGKKIKQIIFVPGKLINFVIK